MCLLIEVVMSGVPGAVAGEVSRAATAADLLALHAQRQARGEPGARFLISEPHEGCACSLTADDADWNASHYTLRPDAAEHLARTLEFLLDRAGPDGLYVRAAWVSDPHEPLAHPSAHPVAASTLLADVRAARIANNRVYRVLGAAG